MAPAAPALKFGQKVTPFGDWPEAVRWKFGEITGVHHGAVSVVSVDGRHLSLPPSRLTWKPKLGLWAAWPDTHSRWIAVIEADEQKADRLGPPRARPLILPGDPVIWRGRRGFVMAITRQWVTVSISTRTNTGWRSRRTAVAAEQVVWDEDEEVWRVVGEERKKA